MPTNRELVGWTDPAEWEYVLNNVFSGDTERIQHGLDVINIWKCRYAGRIPVAIEATVQIIGSKYFNEHCSDLIRRLSMATAISQFVGLLTERALKGQIHSIPMRQRGEKFGIPQWLTSTRHDIAHGLIPTLTLLQKGIDFALRWLKINHWDEHLKWIQSKSDYPVEEIDNAAVVEPILNYIFANTKKTAGSKPPPLSELLPVVENLVQYNIISIPSYAAGNMQHCDKPALCNSVMKQFGKILESLRDSNQLDALLCGIYKEVNYPYMPKTAVDKLVNSIVEISNGSCSNPFTTEPSSTDMDILQDDNVCETKSNYNINIPSKSWNLCDYDLTECSLGLMPGQRKETLWQDLHGEMLSKMDIVGISCHNEERIVHMDVSLQHCNFDLL